MKMYFEKIGEDVFLVDEISSYTDQKPVIYGRWTDDFTTRKMINAMKRHQKYHQEKIDFFFVDILKRTTNKIDF